MQQNKNRKSTNNSVSQAATRFFLRFIVASYLAIVGFLKLVGPRQKELRGDEQFEVLLTGTFYSENWILSHIKPLVLSRECARVIVVTDFPLPTLPGVKVIMPFSWTSRFLGHVPSRLITFLWAGFRWRPKIVGGFHLLFNGLVSVMLARFIGARALYFCVGGPTETLHGGRSENRLFGKLKAPDPLPDCNPWVWSRVQASERCRHDRHPSRRGEPSPAQWSPIMRSFLVCCGAILLFVTILALVVEFWLPSA